MNVGVLVTGRADAGLLEPTIEALGANVCEPVRRHTAVLGSKLDWLVVLGDREKTFISAWAAKYAGIRVAHIHGGEISGESWMDAYYRDMITRLADVHFPCTQAAAEKIAQILGFPLWEGTPEGGIIKSLTHKELGSAKSLLRVAAPCMTKIRKITLENQPSLGACGNCGGPVHKIETEYPDGTITPRPTCLKCKIEWSHNKEFAVPEKKRAGYCVVCYHGGALDTILSSLPSRAIVFRGNSDKSVPPDYDYHPDVSHMEFLRLIYNADFCIGNSSSFVIEAPALHTPSIIVGDRQKGRIQSPSVMEISEDKREIISAVNWAINYEGKFLNAYDYHVNIEDIIMEVLWNQ